MARYRVLRRGMTAEEYEYMPTNTGPRHLQIVYEPQVYKLFKWFNLDTETIYSSREKAESRIFAEKAGEELVVSEYITKDDPLYQITNVVED